MVKRLLIGAASFICGFISYVIVGVPSGTKYHSEGCGYLHDNAIPVPITDEENRGYVPCSRCR